MADDLERLEDWLVPLLHKLEPAQRRQLAREVALSLRKANQQTMAAQTSPEGEAWEPRKHRAHDARGKLRQGPMFRKLRNARNLKARGFANEAVVQFLGRAERIARVHHLGLRDFVNPGGAEYDYPARPMLGINEHQLEEIRDFILESITATS
ncbi:phage virion morphogenesis protein [Comamonas sp. Y33R10-2]|uniref:phage virion morphogenesis protein n=1 Tax=Comamonas sp. Y33R10-2 TaxID=2853257 RepID=UPI001C5CB692|nr:phage virion morphogenesis protein [Comamonas sp. Y33R10-2]QXZ10275.1 phage virion morphogenesis protein [Comamonas sp. Y33R10-2]